MEKLFDDQNAAATSLSAQHSISQRSMAYSGEMNIKYLKSQAKPNLTIDVTWHANSKIFNHTDTQ